MGTQRMREAIVRLGYGNQQIGSNVATFGLQGPLAISAVEQTRFLPGLAHQQLPFPRRAQQQVAEITKVDTGPGWSLHAKTGWQNVPDPGVGWWVGWVQKGDQIPPLFSEHRHGPRCRCVEKGAVGPSTATNSRYQAGNRTPRGIRASGIDLR
jgi:beta-lactamase class D